ncbi:MAG TPA: mechanosensitive ion channel family protein [Micromonosporaceae bacterium]
MARTTGVSWADSGYLAVTTLVRVALIVAGAIVLRALVHRLVRRMIARVTNRAQTPRRSLLHPLRQRLPMLPVPELSTVRSERRGQRAEALGSVLRSSSSLIVFTVAAMLILSEFGLDLAPLLASAGIAGVALGFGAQNLVKDFLAGLFMLLEDQYGVGDVVDLGQVSGTVEEIGLRITTVRDAQGVLWYIRNGEIIRVGNRSQGWAVVVIDVPVGFAGVEEATDVLRAAAATLTEDPEYADDLMEAPEVLGVEQINIDGAVVRTTVKTASTAQWRVGRELRRRLTEALESAGIAQHLTATRLYVPKKATPGPAITEPLGDGEVGGVT